MKPGSRGFLLQCNAVNDNAHSHEKLWATFQSDPLLESIVDTGFRMRGYL